jgi:hypothetical protein
MNLFTTYKDNSHCDSCRESSDTEFVGLLTPISEGQVREMAKDFGKTESLDRPDIRADFLRTICEKSYGILVSSAESIGFAGDIESTIDLDKLSEAELFGEEEWSKVIIQKLEAADVRRKEELTAAAAREKSLELDMLEHLIKKYKGEAIQALSDLGLY